MREDARNLARRISQKGDTGPVLRRHKGTITDINANGTVDLKLDGSTVVLSGIRVLTGTYLVVNDVVEVLIDNTDVFVLGKIASEHTSALSTNHAGSAQGDGTSTLGPINISSDLWTEGFRHLEINGFLEHNQGAGFIDCHLRVSGLSAGYRMQRSVWVGTTAPASGTFGGLSGWIFYCGLRGTVRALIPGFGNNSTVPTVELSSFANIGSAASSFRRTTIGGWNDTATDITSVRLVLVSGGFTSASWLSVYARR